MHDQRMEARVPQNKTGVIRFGAAGHELPCIVGDLTPRFNRKNTRQLRC